jgi:hypothetical protein
MRKKQYVGSNYDTRLETSIDRSQIDLVDELTTPHSYKLNEYIGSSRKIVSTVPAQNPEAQPTQARGGIVWSRAYTFQPHAPSYLDPMPDPGMGGSYG